MNNTPAILAEIVEEKKLEVLEAKRKVSLSLLRDRLIDIAPPRDFAFALSPEVGRVKVIAEIKRKSPSAGWIRPEYEDDSFRPGPVAARYHECGASAISCLTDEKFFGGKLPFLAAVKAATSLPVLRKDFLIDPYQVYEARVAGADAILLIAECLGDELMREMLDVASELRLSVLIEVHDEENLRRVAPLVTPGSRRLLGVNNRDLRTMKVDLEHSFAMHKLAPFPDLFVSESGIRTKNDLNRLRDAGVRTVLVGEHLMREKDPGEALRLLLGADLADSR
ncbi:MAG: indole-3-glycerol phosphate synthase TrpC [Phycisphaerales bacterium]